MKRSGCTEAGRILKTFGYKGEMIAQVRAEFIDIIVKEGSVFIETDEELVPFFIEYVEEGNQDLFTFKFEEIDDVGQAKEFTGNTLWLPLSVIPEDITTKDLLVDIKGYRVIDRNYGEVGIAEEVIEMPQQSILRIHKEKKEILLPVNEQFVLGIDRKKKQIHIDAPAGLIEAYLG
jgi:16S rRNA processing protein RimM